MIFVIYERMKIIKKKQNKKKVLVMIRKISGKTKSQRDKRNPWGKLSHKHIRRNSRKTKSKTVKKNLWENEVTKR